MLMLAEPDGAARVMLFILLCVASDVGGYTVGRPARQASRSRRR